MIKRYEPKRPDGINKNFELPDDYLKDTKITVFVNGQLVDSMNDINHPYGYTLDSENKIFSFYKAPYSDERLYVMYEIYDIVNITFDNIDWDKKIKVVNWDLLHVKKEWNVNNNSLLWETKTYNKEWKTYSNNIEWNEKIQIINFDYKTCQT